MIANLPVPDPAPGSVLTVPIRLSLPSFNVGDTDLAQVAHDKRDAVVVNARLDEWIVRQLIEVYGVAPSDASALSAGGWVMPVLDGLDEMDSAAGAPYRATAVVRALNHNPRPIVITCRTAFYDQLTQSPVPAGQGFALQDITAIRIAPLSPQELTVYLTYRFPDPADSAALEPRWRPVVRYLGRRPSGALAATLASPLWLFMAITAYSSPDTKPAELTKLSGEKLRGHLLSSLIPALAAQHPGPGGNCYDAAEVTRWLSSIAAHLQARRDEHGDGTDIELQQLWKAAGPRSRIIAAACTGGLAGVPLLLLSIGFVTSRGVLNWSPADTPAHLPGHAKQGHESEKTADYSSGNQRPAPNPAPTDRRRRAEPRKSDPTGHHIICIR